MRFWLETCPFSGEPQYAVEWYGHTRIFAKLEFLQEFRDKLDGAPWDAFNHIVLQPVKNVLRGRTDVVGKYRAIRYGSEHAYVLVRHHKEIARFLDIAIAKFSTSANAHPEARTSRN